MPNFVMENATVAERDVNLITHIYCVMDVLFRLQQ